MSVDAILAPLVTRLEELDGLCEAHARKEDNARQRAENAAARYEEIKEEGAANKAERIRLARAVASIKGEPDPYPPKPAAATKPAASASGTTSSGLPKGKRRPPAKTVKRLSALRSHMLDSDAATVNVKTAFDALGGAPGMGGRWGLLRDSVDNCGYLFGLSVGTDGVTVSCDPDFSSEYATAKGQASIPGTDGGASNEGEDKGEGDNAGEGETDGGASGESGEGDSNEGASGEGEAGADE